MTMTMTSSQFGLEDMEALLWGPSSPTADALDSLFFRPDREEHHEGGGTSQKGDMLPPASSSLSSSSSPPPFYSPPPSPPAVLLHGEKAGDGPDPLALPWLDLPGQLRCSQTASDDGKEDTFGDLDWMAEKMDFEEFDLESLIGIGSPTEESPSSTKDLLASLECPMELNSIPMPTFSTPELSSLPSVSLPSTPPTTTLPSFCEDASLVAVDESESYTDLKEDPLSPMYVPEPQQELEIKSEPTSPEPSATVFDSPSSPVNTLDLGSEVVVLESEAELVVPQLPRLVFSISPTRIVLLLAPKSDTGILATAVTTTPEVVVHSSPPVSPPPTPPHKTSRSRPYPEPKCKVNSPPSPTSVKVGSTQGAEGEERKVSLKAPKGKKEKKMEQNKTAATRYRQKKRAEQDAISSEYALLERKNVELTEKAGSIAREIEYLKELIDEVRHTRSKKGLGPDL